MTANQSLQADKGKLSRHLLAHMARPLAVAAELSRYSATSVTTTNHGEGTSRELLETREFRSKSSVLENAIPKPLRLRSAAAESEASVASVEQESPTHPRGVATAAVAYRESPGLKGRWSRTNYSLVRTLDGAVTTRGIRARAAHLNRYAASIQRNA